MYLTTTVVLILAIIGGTVALDCTQILDSEIRIGNTVFIPGGSGELQPIPANFNCVYTIKAPIYTGTAAIVTLKNGLRGVNDYILVTEQDGHTKTIYNRTTGIPDHYTVITAAEMTIQVVTRSVFMGSKFSITVQYQSSNVGPNIQMKTGGDMNFFDLSTLRDGRSLFNSVTFVGTEPIFMSLAIGPNGALDCWDCFVVDGTVSNQTRVYRLDDISMRPFVTTSNAITIFTSVDDFFGVVLNPVSESSKFQSLYSLATVPVEDNESAMRTFYPGFLGAAEVVNFDSTGIIMSRVTIMSPTCEAYVVSGPPNNSSTVLLDLSNATMPHNFDLKYFSVINKNCTFEFEVRSYND
ncbi:hypothetical protein CAEBREN_17472 [Caenorhabditis brenneri]|uniref:CUB-like domain-containing protein n=1 Tax=Caenorhabditis brenneri TaxID=135651 RepID=G0NSW2_CAEBE|nr:hypothetical protein CAEBREN_17472 [Caenorhabditis brenneri]